MPRPWQGARGAIAFESLIPNRACHVPSKVLGADERGFHSMETVTGGVLR